MAYTDIAVNLVTQADTRALTRADKQFKSFQTTLRKVARTLGTTLSVAAIVGYSKAAVKAANEDSKAQRSLATQLANVGLSFEKIRVEDFISRMEKTTGILDDQLRPAFAQLVRVTGSVNKTQELLGVAFDTAAGTGKDLGTVVDILSKAYVGNYKGIKQLNLGLSDAELKTKSFNDLIVLMEKNFKNAGRNSVTALDIMNVGIANIKEQFGFGLTDGMAIKNDQKNLDDLANSFDGLYKAARGGGFAGGLILKGISQAITNTMNFLSKEGLFKMFGGFGAPYTNLAPLSKQTKAQAQAAKEDAKYAALRKKAEEDAIKRQKQLASQQKASLLAQQKSVALQKLSNLLRQAQKVFDNEAITLAAAAQGKLTDEERARLKLKQDIYNLEQAIAEENVTKATQIAQTLVKDAELLGQLSGLMNSLNGIPNPFESWLNSLKEMLSILTAVPALVGKATYSYGGGTSGTLGSAWQPETGTFYNPYNPNNDLSGLMDGSIGSAYDPNMGGFYNPYGNSNSAVNITINPAVAGLIDVIQDSSASGVSSSVSRINTSYIA